MDTSKLTTSVKGFYKSVKTSYRRKRESASTSDNSDALGGFTADQLASSSKEPIEKHISDLNNPHNDTAAGIGMYTKPEVDEKIRNLVPQGMFPISRYGDLGWLPVGVAGDFEGSTTVKAPGDSPENNREFYTMQLEDDGSLVFLRNGTNGVTQGVYYGYVPNAIHGNNTPISTNRRYALPDGKDVSYIYQGGDGVIAGRLAPTSGQKQTDTECFIALTAGTLNNTEHHYVRLSAKFDLILTTSEVVLGHDAVYIVYLVDGGRWVHQGKTQDLQIYRIPLPEFKSGLFEPELITFATQRGMGGAGYGDNQTTFRVSDRGFSYDANDQRCLWKKTDDAPINSIDANTWAGCGRPVSTSTFNDQGTILRTMIIVPIRYTSQPGVWWNWNYVTLNMDFNVQTKAIALHDSNKPLVIVKTDDTTKIEGRTTYPSMFNSPWDTQLRLYIPNDNLVFMSGIRWSDAQRDLVYRMKMVTPVSKFDRLADVLPYYGMCTVKEVACPFGSDIGDGLMGFIPLWDGGAITQSRNNRSTSDFVRFEYDTNHDGQPTKQYTMTDGSTYMGFPPKSERNGITTYGDKPTPYDLSPSISYIDNGLVELYLTYFASGWKTTRRNQIDPDLKYLSGESNVDESNIKPFMDQIISDMGLGDANRKFYELVVTPEEDFPPLLMVTAVRSSDGKSGMTLCTVEVSSRVGDVRITKIKDKLFTKSLGFSNTSSVKTLGVGWSSPKIGRISVYRTNDGWGVTWLSAFTGDYPQYGDGSAGSLILQHRFWLNNDEEVEGLVSRLGDYDTPEKEVYAVVPHQGIGAIQGINSYTALRFRLMARNKAEFLAWTDSVSVKDQAKQEILMVSQSVKTGWMLYFTQTTPAVLDGVYYEVEPTAINLADVTSDPANKLFTVFLELDKKTNTLKYVVDEGAGRLDTGVDFYIGYLKTNGSRIAEIQISKQTRFDEEIYAYRPKHLSTVSSLGGIPVTEGDPLSPAKIKW